MPALEMAQETGTLLRWLKDEGEQVQRGEPLMEIETDKVTLEIESGGSGDADAGQRRAGRRGAGGPGDRPVAGGGRSRGSPGSRERGASQTGKGAARKPCCSETGRSFQGARRCGGQSAGAAPGRRARRGPERAARNCGAHLEGGRAGLVAAWNAERPAGASRVLASPLARRLAAERGIELATLTGSGPQGAVLAGDIQAVAPAAAPAVIAADAAAADDVLRVVPLTGMRGAIAARTQASARNAPHISLTLSADMSAALQLQQQLSPAVEAASGHKLTLTTLLARAVAATLKTHARLNAQLLEDGIHEYRPVHLGVAVALADGLLVPVMRDCAALGLAQLQASLQQLAQRARARTLTVAELRGATFTLSNLGMYGIEHFSAIINPPEVAILAVGAVQERVVAVEGQAVVRPMLQLTINVDHRAVDGAVAAAFLRDLKQLLEDPWSLLV